MRRFFRFSIRDLLWLTLVVAAALGWFVRERQLRADVDQANSRATKWRRVAGALEFAIAHDPRGADRHVNYDRESLIAWIVQPSTKMWPVDLTSHEPSLDDD